ncbi:MAG: (dimethylallyl)adenosine tRNA methylthiotransferase [Alphaproteobacteria bacterium]|jgi:tRNA-2-methylthio-N6-dimethylallyladenosine synthase|nr:(dimethylallyl)adenosine tRNA methylthiotransferase [Alphaproteobacteria bacterium]
MSSQTLQKKNLYIKTYGCQMNVYDSERMADMLMPLGYTITDSPDHADMVILNTCHIREKAEQKVFSDLGRLRDKRDERRAQGADTVIVVSGCVAQAEGAEIIRQAPYVDIVVGPQTYHRLPEMIAKATRAVHTTKKPGQKKGLGIVDVDFPVESKFDSLPQTAESRVAAYLSIQEGCDKFCTFCVVPYTRGAEYSRPATEILAEARHLLSLGTKEITLLGQNVNAYHGQAPLGTEWGLGRLIRELADLGVDRIRYTTSHPRDMNQDLIDAHRDVPALMPFLHLPVQSGSDRILEAMNRKHTSRTYIDIIERLRNARSDMGLSSDFIVGFPGETDKDFEETLALVHHVNYAQSYSFKYSIRPGTPAGAMDDQVPEEVKADRLQQLQDLLNEQQLTFNQKTVGTVQSVLLDRKGRQEGQFIGRSPYMQSVVVNAPDRLFGQVIDVRINQAHPNSVSGTVVTHEV